jgi:phosphoribosylformylglycinamidine synthase
VECASRGDVGVDIDVALVPRREDGMNAYEIMLSESQERMVLVATPDRVAEITDVLNHWSLNASVIGQVTDTGRVVVRDGDEVVCDVPVRNFIDDCPVYPIDPDRPAYLDDVEAFDLESIPDIAEADIATSLEQMLRSPNLGSRRSIWEQYDHTILTNTVVGPGQGDAAVIRQKGTSGGMAISMDCNSRYVYLDPYLGAQHAVAEAARNVACAGARPLGLTNCLNFGSPERNPADYQLVQAVKGMGDASRQLDVPIVSGNVSLYNETARQPVYPTPMIGCVGVLEDIQAHMRMTWTNGQTLWLIGSGKPSLGGSEYLAHMHGTVAGTPPELDLENEVRLIRFLRELANSKYGAAVHDLSAGGLALAIAEMALTSGIGLSLNDYPDFGRNDLTWFGESAGRVLVAVDSSAVLQLRRLAEEWDLVSLEIGAVGGNSLIFPGGSEITLTALELASESALAVGVEAEMA